MPPKFLTGLLGQRSKVEALRCLFAEQGELAGREVARRCGLSHPIIHKALSELEREGVVLRRVAPPTHLFRLNRKNWLVSRLLAGLFERELHWQEDMEALIRKDVPEAVVSLVLFGSLIQGKFSAKSDVDVLVLVKDAKSVEPAGEHFADVGARVYETFHHPLAPVILPIQEFRRRYREGVKFAKDISYSGKVIHGKLLTEVLFEHGGKKD
ncbi:MAG: nucleotidyltransferase domain-containing protein [Elusimicrobiota bacterium]